MLNSLHEEDVSYKHHSSPGDPTGHLLHTTYHVLLARFPDLEPMCLHFLVGVLHGSVCLHATCLPVLLLLFLAARFEGNHHLVSLLYFCVWLLAVRNQFGYESV